MGVNVERVDIQEDELKEYKVIRDENGNEKSGKGKKKLLKIVGWLLAAVVALLILAVIFRDLLIAGGIRHIGSMVTGTQVKIDTFKTSFDGTILLQNIRVGNPAGYQKPYAVEIDRIYVKLLVPSLTSQEPVIEAVEVKGVRLDMEMKGGSKSNLGEIQGNVEKFAGAGSADKKKESSGKSEKAQDGPSPIIKTIDLTSMAVSFSSSKLKSSVPVPLAPIHLKNVGGKGIPLRKTLFTILDTLMRSINTVGGTVISSVEAIGNAGKGIGSGINGIFNKKK